MRAAGGPVVGVHLVGARVGELIGEAQLITGWGAYPDDVAGLLHAHPTQHEALGEAHLALAGKPLHTHWQQPRWRDRPWIRREPLRGRQRTRAARDCGTPGGDPSRSRCKARLTPTAHRPGSMTESDGRTDGGVHQTCRHR